jgi:hypothetical protein
MTGKGDETTACRIAPNGAAPLREGITAMAGAAMPDAAKAFMRVVEDVCISQQSTQG